MTVIFLILVFGVIGVLILAVIFTYFINPFREGYRLKEKANSSTYTNNNINREDELKEKGDEFEKFTVTKFDSKYFKILDWRSDKYVDGVYAESSKNPDLEIEYSHKETSKRFAVECKYRSKIYEDVLISKQHKIEHYKNYSKKNRIPVFIVLGMGGDPSSPSECYVIPINKVYKEIIPYKSLQQYRKFGVNSNFFFNTTLLSLT